jgi:hypothetical protein
MIANRVGAKYPDRFRVALGKVQAASIGSTGNAVITIPITEGTEYIVRQITVTSATGSINTANVVILTSNDGNASNAVSNVTVLSNVTSNVTYQDIPLATGAATTAYTAGALFVKVNTAVTNGICAITVFGDVVEL